MRYERNPVYYYMIACVLFGVIWIFIEFALFLAYIEFVDASWIVSDRDRPPRSWD